MQKGSESELKGKRIFDNNLSLRKLGRIGNIVEGNVIEDKTNINIRPTYLYIHFKTFLVQSVIVIPHFFPLYSPPGSCPAPGIHHPIVCDHR